MGRDTHVAESVIVHKAQNEFLTCASILEPSNKTSACISKRRRRLIVPPAGAKWHLSNP
jgi:hypothetical protein